MAEYDSPAEYDARLRQNEAEFENRPRDWRDVMLRETRIEQVKAEDCIQVVAEEIAKGIHPIGSEHGEEIRQQIFRACINRLDALSKHEQKQKAREKAKQQAADAGGGEDGA